MNEQLSPNHNKDSSNADDSYRIWMKKMQEAKNPLFNPAKTKDQNQEIKPNHDIWEGLTDEYDSDRPTESMIGLEKSIISFYNFEKTLSNPDLLKVTKNHYLNQYQPDSESRADFLYGKTIIDNHIIMELSNNNSPSFLASPMLKNYSNYITSIARQKTQTINKKTYYPELVTNPILANPTYRKFILFLSQSEDQPNVAEETERIKKVNKILYDMMDTEPKSGKILTINKIFNNLAEHEIEYKKLLANIENKLENKADISQEELDIVGDYLYSSRNFHESLAKKFANYIFNEAKQNPNLKSSPQIGGALANYFVYQNTLDDRLKNRHLIIANRYRWNNEKNKANVVFTGLSSRDYCVLEQNCLAEMSLSSDEDIKRSRPETINDLYSLMFASFHELTHDYQKLMVNDGENNSSAMASILNKILRQNQNKCFPEIDNELNKVLDKNGNEVKTDYYEANHDSDEIEIQADEESWRQCRKFIQEHEIMYYWNKDHKNSQVAFEHWSNCRSNEREVKARRTFALKVNEHGEEMPYIQYDIEQLSKSIKANPEILKEFQQLSSFFDQSGLIKPQLFFERTLGDISTDSLDTTTDDFGVEISTYTLLDDNNVRNIISYINNSDNTLDQAQINCCTSNLWNALRQNALKTNHLESINFDNYINTKTRGKNTSIQDIKNSYLKQYLHQLLNCIHITEALKNNYPEAEEAINYKEQNYYISLYDRLSKNINLDSEYSKKLKKRYKKTKNLALQQLIGRL